MANIPEFLPLYDDIVDKSERRIDELLTLINQAYNPLPLMFVNAAATGTTNLPTKQNEVRLIAYAYLRARSWNVKEAFEMVKLSIAFRQRYNVDTMRLFPSAIPILGFNQNDIIARLGVSPREPNDPLTQICNVFNPFIKAGFHYYDKRGLPVAYWILDHVDAKAAMKKVKQSIPVGSTLTEMSERYAACFAETGWALCRYHDLYLREHPNPALNMGNSRRNFVTVVIDTKRLSTKMLHKPTIDMLKDMVSRMNNYYADCIHRVLVVNCPPLVRFAYNIMKSAINEGLQKKVVFVSPADTPLALDRVIGKERVPSFLSGTCNCPGGCIPGFNPNSVLSAEEDSSDIVTEDIKLTAGDKHEKVFELAQGEDVTWEFVSTKGVDVRFTINFYPKHSGMAAVDAKKKRVRIDKKVKKTTTENPLVKMEKLTDGADHFTAPEDGILQLIWDNSKSWVQDKPVQMRVFRSDPIVEEVM